MADLNSVDPIADVDVIDNVRIPVRKNAVAGWLRLSLLQTASYIQTKLFGDLTGNGGKYVKVNDDEDGFEFGTGGGGGGSGVPDGGTTGQVLTKLSNDDGDADWETPSGGGSGGGGGGRVPFTLGVLRPLSDFDQVNISGDTDVIEYSGKAIVITDTNPAADTNKLRGLSIDAPAAPYRVMAFVAHNSLSYPYHGIAFGHEDAAGKYRVAALIGRGDSDLPAAEMVNFSDANTRVAVSGIGVTAISGVGGIWVSVEDDGTTVTYGVSGDGATVIPVGKFAKSGSYLADYDRVFIGQYNLAYARDGADWPISITLLDYDEDGLSREPGGTTVGGGGGSTPWYFDPPTTALLDNAFGTDVSVTDDADVGMIILRTSGNNADIAGQSIEIPDPASDWWVKIKQVFATSVDPDDYANRGLVVHNTAEDKFVCWSWDTRRWFHLYRVNASGFDGYETNVKGEPCQWWQISYDASSGEMTFYVSGNGKTWHTYFVRNIKTNDFGGSDPTFVGVFCGNESYDFTADTTIEHWSSSF